MSDFQTAEQKLDAQDQDVVSLDCAAAPGSRKPSTRHISLWEHLSMENAQIGGFHKVKGVRITHGVPHSVGWFRTKEVVEIRLPARVLADKQAMNLLVDPAEYAGTAQTPGVVYYSGSASFWLYKATVFIDFEKRKNGEVKTIADRLLAPPMRQPKPRPTTRMPKRRESIPNQLKIDVWQRDSGRCVECGAKENLEFDHMIPLKLGGANTFRNLQLLCSACNKSKGANL